MAKKTAPLLPANTLRLQQFGDRLRLARLRRRLTAKQVAERAGMTTVTLRNLERGGSGVTVGAYLAVMQVLGVEQDIDLLARDDPLGRQLQDAALPRRARRATTTTQPAQPANEGSAARAKQAPPAPAPATGRATNWAAEGGFTSADSLAALIQRPATGARNRKP